VDTVVMAAATVLRLQTVVSREIPATESAVVTVGALQAGTKENIIPEEAELKLSVRTFDPVVNDDAATKRVSEAFIARFGAERVVAAQAQTGSEDFGVYGVRGGFRSVFWFVGGSDPQTYARAERVGRVDRDIPTNHSPDFAPVLEPTLSTGVETLVVAAMAWLSPGGGVDDA
jgi:hippurate hydrolase